MEAYMGLLIDNCNRVRKLIRLYNILLHHRQSWLISVHKTCYSIVNSSIYSANIIMLSIMINTKQQCCTMIDYSLKLFCFAPNLMHLTIVQNGTTVKMLTSHLLSKFYDKGFESIKHSVTKVWLTWYSIHFQRNLTIIGWHFQLWYYCGNWQYNKSPLEFAGKYKFYTLFK